MSETYTRIDASRLDEQPTVLDTKQAANVLRMSQRRVREEANAGNLRRLTYSASDYLFSDEEVRRYIREATTPCDGEDDA